VPARLHSGIVLDAEVIRINDEADVALIKLPGSSFKALSLRAAGEPPIGSDVFVVGNPRLKELDASVSKGVVSGNRSIGGHKYLQTDAAANPGSSGGPVLDRKGNVLGIISWKFAGAEVQGLAFAVPLADAMSSLNINLAPTP
jgi:S1-C subfamily serine protease